MVPGPSGSVEQHHHVTLSEWNDLMTAAVPNDDVIMLRCVSPASDRLDSN